MLIFLGVRAELLKPISTPKAEALKMPYFIGFAEKCGANGGSLRPLFLFLQVKSVKASALDLQADRFYSYQSLNGRLRTPETELSL